MIPHLMTRGTPRRLDYRFVGDGPPRRWWAPLDDAVVFERPAVVVHRGVGGLGVLVSGVPSARRDIIGTAIRWTVVVDDPGSALLDRLVAAGLDPEGREKLGARLDAAFPAEQVDALLSGHDTGVAAARARLAEVLGGEEDHGPVGEPTRPAERSWMGATGRPAAVAEFRQRAAQLAAGVPGWAFTTAALSSQEGVRRAIAPLGAPAAVLVDDEGPEAVVELDGPGDLGKGGAGAVRRTTILAGVAALLVILAVTAVLVARSGTGPAAAPSSTPPSTSASISPGPVAGGGPGPSG